MKLVREHINEKFTQDSDPIEDLEIGIIKSIKKWLITHDIFNFEINKDLTIDVHSDVDISGKLNGNLPEYINFNYVKGKFKCDYCNMTTLRGCPKEVGWYFSCSDNKLTSLDHMPKKTDNVYCSKNKKLFSVKDVLDRCDVLISIFVSGDDRNYDWINPKYK
jgi:hypothetical protein